MIDVSYKSNTIREDITIKKFTGTDIDFKSVLKFKDSDLTTCESNYTNYDIGY